ncbi:putative Chymotrypsinogen B [Hypsibius exemplaris]|uniref:Chymotrypsinogen B n=1 Tax=Hypsibius exemplaris TaxID=2072580 RepID=A0A9X6NB15_HYPEX|nr:putative Chymotrypsinogen B [Hypsibius exemplaris]
MKTSLSVCMTLISAGIHVSLAVKSNEENPTVVMSFSRMLNINATIPRVAPWQVFGQQRQRWKRSTNASMNGAPEESVVVLNPRLRVSVSAHDYPFIVSLRKRGGQHFCAGSLLSDTHVLTAAHCVVPELTNGKRFRVINASDYEVGVGLHNRNGGNWRNWYAIKSIQPHEEYINPDNFKVLNDIALITLTKSVLAATKAGRIELPLNRNTNPQPGDRLLTIGWGKTTVLFDDLPEDLQGARLTVITDTECAKRLGKGRTMPTTNICTDNDGATTCSGDSGGPLFKVIGTKKFQLVGITSYGWKKCTQDKKASVFTRVSQYLPWILAAQANRSPRAHGRRHQ